VSHGWLTATFTPHCRLITSYQRSCCEFNPDAESRTEDWNRDSRGSAASTRNCDEREEGGGLIARCLASITSFRWIRQVSPAAAATAAVWQQTERCREGGGSTWTLFRNCADYRSNESFAGVVVALRMTSLQIPQHVVLNETVHMQCNFNLDKEILYSVKWYKDGHEFYRYVPSDAPQVVTFPVPGVNVNVSMKEAARTRECPETGETRARDALSEGDRLSSAASVISTRRIDRSNRPYAPENAPGLSLIPRVAGRDDVIVIRISIRRRASPRDRREWIVEQAGSRLPSSLPDLILSLLLFKRYSVT